MTKILLRSEIEDLQEMPLKQINFMLNFQYNLKNPHNYVERYRVYKYINIANRHQMEFIVLDKFTKSFGKIIMDDYRVSHNPYISSKVYANLMNSRNVNQNKNQTVYQRNYPKYLQSKYYGQIKKIMRNKNKKVGIKEIIKAIEKQLNVAVEINLLDDDFKGLLTYVKSKDFLAQIEKSIEKAESVGRGFCDDQSRLNISEYLKNCKLNNFSEFFNLSYVQKEYLRILSQKEFNEKVISKIKQKDFLNDYDLFKNGNRQKFTFNFEVKKKD